MVSVGAQFSELAPQLIVRERQSVDQGFDLPAP